VLSGLWALYEIENGKFKLSSPSDRLVDKTKRKPIKEYFSPQGRFRNLKEEDIQRIEKWIDEDWEKYRKLASDDAPELALHGKA
jgi:pyruvate ferredoxin oxidoreductase beta subunit